MKRAKSINIVYLVLWNLLLISLILFFQNNSYGQYRKPPNFLSKLAQGWSIGANAGRTSFYGDVSLYDEEFNEKVSKEGSYGFGASISRQMTPIIGLNADIMIGELAGSNSKSHFVSNIKEISGHVTLNFVNLLIPDNNARFSPYAKFGFGQFIYSTTLVYNDPNMADVTAEATAPEFVYMFGGGVYYVLNNSFNVQMEMMGRRMDSDKIDGSTKNSKDNDYYSYLSIGMVYKIFNVPRDVRYYKRLGMKSQLIRRY